MPQLRQNLITGEWVVIAPERAKRPDDFITAGRVRYQAKAECPFCPGRQAFRQRLKEAETENIYVVENKFPAFVPSIDHVQPRSYQVEGEFYYAKPSLGAHEVINIKEHDLDLPKFSPSLILEMFEVIQKRYLFHKKDKKNEYSMAIYNQGPEAGATVGHPHAQLFVSSIVPNYVLRELHGSENYYTTNGVCVFCDLIKHEQKAKTRVLAENKQFILFAFYAARFPFEMWILPKKHESQFEKEEKESLKNLSLVLKQALVLLDKSLNNPPLNFFIHTLPNTMKSCAFYHWHIEITPRVSKYGGYELGSGNIIDVVSPERAAEFLRKVKA